MARTEINGWGAERGAIEDRIISLHDDQIAALLNLVGPRFALDDLRDVVAEIREKGHDSLHLDILLREASSRDELLWWLELFEETGRRAA